jgi:6-phosphogluconolactonase
MWHEYPSTQECIESLSRWMMQHMQECMGGSNTCTIAVSGGRSPIPLFHRLSGNGLDWSRVQVRLVDERYVPPDHRDSNERLVRTHLLVDKAANAQFLGLYRAGQPINAAVLAANTDMAGRAVDLAVLGMGDDGHMASLFPEARQLDAGLSPNAAYYLHVTPPDAPHERISMSLRALRACPRLILYISGAHKRSVLQQAQQAIDKNLPISYLVADPGVSLDVYWHP